MVEKTHASGFWPSLYEPFRSLGSRVADWFAPASEASSNKAAYSIAIELPGVAEDDIRMTLEDGVVTVSGEKRTAREEEGESWYFSERQFGAFSRSFRLPPDADEDAVGATLKNGVLTITVPKRAPTADNGGRTIDIRRG